MATFTDYPLPTYNYKVDIDSTTISFSEISGISCEYESITYKQSSVLEGDNFNGPKVFHIPSHGTPVNINLKKGYIKGEETLTQKAILYDWVNNINKTMEKKDITVSLLDMNGEVQVAWTLSGAFPTKLEMPSFSADSNEIAVESMDLIADGVSRVV